MVHPTRTRHHRALITPPDLCLVPDRSLYPAPASWTAEAVRATFLRGGELVPPVQWTTIGMGDERYATAAAELAAASRAQSTRRTYGRLVEHWLRWADTQGVCPLPADPDAVHMYIVERSMGLDVRNELERDSEGHLVGALVMGTISQILAAISRLHALANHPSPTDHPQIRTLVEGLGRTLTTAPLLAKAALTWDLLTEVLEAQQAPTSTTALREAVARALHAATGATAGQLARAQWSDITVDPDAITVVLAPTRRGGPVQRHQVALDTDAAQLLTRWRRHTLTWPGTAVLRDETGKALTRQGLHLILTRHDASMAGIPSVEASQVRDRAVLLVGWVSALRRSNLASLTWDQMTRTSAGWLAYLARSKTDQEGRGDTVSIAPAPPGSGLADAVAALDDWLELLTAMWGRDPRRLTGVPVFTRIDRHGHLELRDGRPAGLSGAAIGVIVTKWVAAAGLDQRTHLTYGGHRTATGRAAFGAHSLRAGFVTTGLALGIPASTIIAQTKHTTEAALKPYNKPATRPDLLAATAVLGAVAHDATGPGQPAHAPETRPARRTPRGPHWDAVPWAEQPRTREGS